MESHDEIFSREKPVKNKRKKKKKKSKKKEKEDNFRLENNSLQVIFQDGYPEQSN